MSGRSLTGMGGRYGMKHHSGNHMNGKQQTTTMSLPAPDRDNGYFTPESMIRRINREALVLLGGWRAILLQLAHPFVAAGVDEHSHFQTEILARLHRTLQFMQHLVFADRHRAREALRHFHAMHSRI
ncbi:MAG TPA: oxygenase MpaB family protein, partial [bacterium]|nr:oxygenase MpaB family protein [bacterium]